MAGMSKADALTRVATGVQQGAAAGSGKGAAAAPPGEPPAAARHADAAPATTGTGDAKRAAARGRSAPGVQPVADAATAVAVRGAVTRGTHRAAALTSTLPAIARPDLGTLIRTGIGTDGDGDGVPDAIEDFYVGRNGGSWSPPPPGANGWSKPGTPRGAILSAGDVPPAPEPRGEDIVPDNAFAALGAGGAPSTVDTPIHGRNGSSDGAGPYDDVVGVSNDSDGDHIPDVIEDLIYGRNGGSWPVPPPGGGGGDGDGGGDDGGSGNGTPWQPPIQPGGGGSPPPGAI